MMRLRGGARLLALVTTVALVVGCTKKEEILQPIVNQEAPHFVASPDSILVADTAPHGVVYIAADAPGTLAWRITGKPAWLAVDPESGLVTTTPVAVGVTAHAAGLSPGTHGGVVSFLSSGGEDRLTVLFSVAVHPLLSASVSSLHFPAGETLLPFSLQNTGTGMIQWNASDSETWMTVSPSAGYISAGGSASVTVRVDRSGLAPGAVSGAVTIASNSESGSITVDVTMDVPAAPILSVSPDSLRFGYFTNAATFRVRNPGNAPLAWSASGVPSYLVLDAVSGTLSAGDSIVVTGTADRTGLGTSVYTSGITIDADPGQSAIVGVRLDHFEETKWLLDHNVVDAEFSRATNRIVTVSEGPSRLRVLDPDTRAVQEVDLSLSPRCVSIAPDGQHAVVGHDGYASYVDLSTMTVTRVYGVTADAVDIVLAGNGWFYVFPVRDQWVSLHCIEVATGVETLGSGTIRAGTLARLHPSGDYIYGADNGLSPSDIEKYDIRSGTSVLLYDSPYHGDYPMSGNLWIMDDGLRLVTRSGYVFRSSTTRSEDMTYNGNLAGASPVAWAEHSTTAGRVYTCIEDSYFGDAPPVIRLYDAQYLAFLGTVPLPPFLVPDGQGGGTLRPAKGRFVFADAAGTRIHVLQRAKPGSGLLHDWAVVTMNADVSP